jgi:hypothetical protein
LAIAVLRSTALLSTSLTNGSSLIITGFDSYCANISQKAIFLTCVSGFCNILKSFWSQATEKLSSGSVHLIPEMKAQCQGKEEPLVENPLPA